jgi:hypothetical protein
MDTKRTSVYRHADLTRLLHPASVAVIGAFCILPASR